MRTRLVPLLVALGSTLGCRTKEPPVKTKAVAAPIAAPAASSAPAPSTIADARVTAFVERWRTAQEASDFDAYGTLYARTFEGVKRSGDKTTRFDRKGWMKDRRQMFQRDVKVKVSDVRVFAGVRSAVVTFVQDWSIPNFRDVGKKRMELALESDALLIAKEEMLDSTIEKASAVQGPKPDAMALLWQLKVGYGAVLHHGKVETKGATRRIEMSDLEGDVLHEKDVTDAALRPFESFRDRTLDLYSSTGIACSAKVKGFRAVGGFTSWGNEEPADETWEHVDQYLVAVVEPENCAGQPLWSRASDLPKPTLFTGRDLTTSETELAGKALGKAPAAREAQARYTAFLEERAAVAPDADAGPRGPLPQSWESYEPNAWSARAFTHPGSGVTYVATERTAGEGCGDFGAYAFGIFKVGTPAWIDLTGDPNPGLSMPLRALFGLVPESAVMLEPGGPLYFVGEEILLTDTGSGFAPIATIGRTRTTCSC